MLDHEFYDKEWEDANKANEEPKYYLVHMLNGGKCYHMYKPSVADIVAKRTGCKMEMVHSEPKKHVKAVSSKPFWL